MLKVCERACVLVHEIKGGGRRDFSFALVHPSELPVCPERTTRQSPIIPQCHQKVCICQDLAGYRLRQEKLGCGHDELVSRGRVPALRGFRSLGRTTGSQKEKVGLCVRWTLLLSPGEAEVGYRSGDREWDPAMAICTLTSSRLNWLP